MSFPAVFSTAMNVEIAIQRFTETGYDDDYGYGEGSWSTIGRAKARISLRGTREERDGRMIEVKRRLASVKPDVDVQHTDRVIMDGTTYEIEAVETVYSHMGPAYKRIVLLEAS